MFGNESVYGRRVKLTGEMGHGKLYTYDMMLPIKGAVGTVTGNHKKKNRFWLVQFDGDDKEWFVSKDILEIIK